MIKLDADATQKRKTRRTRVNHVFTVVCWLTASVSIIVLSVLLISIGVSGVKHLLTSPIAADQLAGVDWEAVAAETELPPIASLVGIDWAAFISDANLASVADLKRADWSAVSGGDAAASMNSSEWDRVVDELRTFDPGAMGDFITAAPSRSPEEAGIGPAIAGTIGICAICALVALPLGVGTALFLEEYKPKAAWLQKLHGFVQLNISNLAGVPSIVYGILGLTVFVQVFGWFGNANDPSFAIGIDYRDQVTDEAGNYFEFPVDGASSTAVRLESGMVATSDLGEEITLRVLSAEEIGRVWEQVDAQAAELPADLSIDAFEAEQDAIRRGLFAGVIPTEDPYIARIGDKSWYYIQIPFGRGVLAGGLTLMLVILPIVIVSSQEAIRAVPPSLREGSFGLGSTKWQAIRRIVLPAAVPGIMTGSILAISRAIGEAAPILILAGIVYITFIPSHLMDDFTAMPLQIYDWAGRPQKPFHEVAASGIIILLAVLLSFNGIAVFIRQKFQKPLS